MMNEAIIQKMFKEGGEILRLAPTWVPRVFCIPGRRIKLHPNDYYAMGSLRGGIDERWLSSTTRADNGPLTSQNEGLSFVIQKDGSNLEKFLLKDAVDILQGDLIGKRLWAEYRCWPIYSKFFDNQGALPHHIHHRDEHAKLVGQKGKPEAYYFPPQLNNHNGDFPYTFFGLIPSITKEQVRVSLAAFTEGDNKLLSLSRAFKLEPGTAWNVPPGVLHAPGSLCTYEPQRASDVFAMYQSLTHGQIIPEELLWKNTPEEKQGNIDYLMEVIDWDLNVDPDYYNNHFMAPKPVKDLEYMKSEGYIESWICYKSEAFSAKELTVLPGQEVIIKDNAAYGMIMTQGHGMMDSWKIETPTLIRYGQLTCDEFFVSENAAKRGIEVKNLSETEPLVMLKHFGPGNPDLLL
ncbi:MAG: hypothetical protein ACFE8N_10175 [Promethearchaeota archaeon]